MLLVLGVAVMEALIREDIAEVYASCILLVSIVDAFDDRLGVPSFSAKLLLCRGIRELHVNEESVEGER